jgi:hypothetical protein
MCHSEQLMYANSPAPARDMAEVMPSRTGQPGTFVVVRWGNATYCITIGRFSVIEYAASIFADRDIATAVANAINARQTQS